MVTAECLLQFLFNISYKNKLNARSTLSIASFYSILFLSIEAILEGLANELRRIVEEREAKNVPATQQELDELDLRLRSLRTQLRKAEELSTQLGKQKREVDEKIEKNKRDV